MSKDSIPMIITVMIISLSFHAWGYYKGVKETQREAVEAGHGHWSWIDDTKRFHWGKPRRTRVETESDGN